MAAMRVALGALTELNDKDLVFARQIGMSGVIYNTLELDNYQSRRFLGLPDWGDYQISPHYTYDNLARLRERVEAHGLAVEAMENLPVRMIGGIRTASPDRDQLLDDYCRSIENIGRVGIPILGYNFMLLQVHRTTFTAPGRGGAACTGFDATSIAADELAFGRRISSDEVWERYEYFIKHVLPVAESAGVRLALHPDDPPVPEAYGVARIFGTLAGHRRALEDVAPSPNHGLNFCCGTWGESGIDKLYDAIEYFSSTDKVFYSHVRNISGVVPTFQETFVDDGDFDVHRVISTLHRNSFTGFVIDDHVPHMADDTQFGHRGRAFASGYLKGIVASVHAGAPDRPVGGQPAGGSLD